MSQLNKELQIITHSKGLEKNMITQEGFRLTLITEQLLRVEVSDKNQFVDDATLSFWNRELEEVKFEVKKKQHYLIIITAFVGFVFDTKLKKVTSVIIDNNEIPCDNKYNLKGTARTLDQKWDNVKLGLGVISRNGVAVIDDSDTLLFKDSFPCEKPFVSEDKYIFAYGHNYRQALVDFYKVAGQTPLLPRYVLGNWWSRYRDYSQSEYIDLMKKFEDKKLPFTVATIDMDWHWVNVNEKFGTNFKGKYCNFQTEGWTGYSWNTDLFPDYKEFFNWLHQHNYYTTLNLHPAAGVRHYEDMYAKIATRMGIDPNTKQTVPFDISSEKFINAYFEELHHPYENDGVDFWWMDWQQGKKSTVKGLDPLWSLNHYHFLDSKKKGRGMLLSRYSGVGSHRYPIGFSGDSFAVWSALKFQPYFTNTASNIGYTWWSHDIGGHMFGYTDDEMYIRWCQYGVFSPINRLHSTNHDLQGKEPWNYSYQAEEIVSKFLRLRHKLIPYIYTMNYRNHTEGIALCEPMYYNHPNNAEAYEVGNQYYFGSELIVNPIVDKCDKKTGLAYSKVWLPEGRFTDIFTKQIYTGGKFINMYRDLGSIPVLAKEGAILCLGKGEDNSCGNPNKMEVEVYRGNGTFSLYEDDGVSEKYKEGKFATTTFNVQEREGKLYFEILPVENDRFATVGLRYYTIKFADIVSANMQAVIDENILEMDFNKEMTFKVPCSSKLKILLTEVEVLQNEDFISQAKGILSKVNGANALKMAKYKGFNKIKNEEEFYKKVMCSTFPKNAKGAIKELYLSMSK